MTHRAFDWWLVLLCTSMVRPLLPIASGSHGSSYHQAGRNSIFSCHLNSMCHCSSYPNETHIHEISCHDVSLYKFPEFLHSSVKHVEIQHNFLQSVDDDTFQGLRLETLKLVNNHIHTLATNSLRSMVHSLMSLDVAGNQFLYLPLAALGALSNLNRLSVQRNKIQHIDGDWGNLVDTLRIIHLSDNSICQIDSLPDDLLSNGVDAAGGDRLDQSNQQHYNNHNRIRSSASSSSSSNAFDPPQSPLSTINGDKPLVKTNAHADGKSFANLRRLIWLDLSGNTINRLHAALLPKSLLTIDLSRNAFHRIPSTLFDLPNLKILSLSGNLIQNLATEPIETHVRLEKLDLSENMIQRIHTHFLSGIRVNAINLAKNFIHHLHADAFGGMNCVHMVLAFNRLDHIDGAAFRSLEETLEYLDLERNNLPSTQPEALGRLKRLHYLYLTANQISDVDYLPETLRVLSLAGNNISRIPLASLERCNDLSYLNMGYNKISEVPENGFIGWGGELQTLLLRNNKITELNFGAFNGLDSIKEISLSFNDIHWIHPNVFENISKSLKILELSFGVYREDFPMEQLQMLSELIWLGLDNNNLKVISDEALITMKELTYINLSFNRIMILPANIFVAEIHAQLMDVDLSYNVLYTVLPYTFDSIPNLQFVCLAHNRIEKLNRHSFNNLPHLNWIDLSYNNLQNITDTAFSLLPALQRLDMTFNNLQWFSFHIFQDVSSEWMPLLLNISHNQVRAIEAIATSVHLTQLDVDHNCINETVAFQHLKSLRRLYLRYNHFTQIGSSAFENMDTLEILALSNNNISSLRRRCFQGLKRLQELDLSNNAIEQLQVEQFSNLKNLRILNLRHNHIRTIPRDAFLNTRIEFLDLSYNELSVWPVAALSDIGFTLRSIHLASNKIVYLDSTMFINSQFLYELNLSNNKLAYLPGNTFTFLSNLTHLDLGHNRIVATNLDEILHFTRRLRRLNISSMGLYELPVQLETCAPQLTEIDASGNLLQGIVELSGLPFLRFISVANNRIGNLSRLTDRLPSSIRILNISNNPVKQTSVHALDSVPFLETLFMVNVRVNSATFLSRLAHLRTLQITGHQNIVDSVASIPSLHHLLIEVPDTTLDSSLFAQLENNTKINLLDITGAQVSTIKADTFNGFRQSQRLVVRIRNTVLTDLPIGLFYVLNTVPHLSIDVSRNQISSLSPDTFYPNASTWDAVGTRSLVGGLDLYSNPLHCDCGLVWLGHWLRRWLRETAQMNVVSREESRHMLERAKRNTCIDPLTGVEMSFLDLFPEDLLCHASALSSISAQLRASAWMPLGLLNGFILIWLLPKFLQQCYYVKQ